MIVFLLGFRTSQIGMEALGLGFEVSCLGFEDWGLGFVILRRNLEAQTPRVSICVWGSRFGAETSNPKLFVSGVRVFAPKPRSLARLNPGPPKMK